MYLPALSDSAWQPPFIFVFDVTRRQTFEALEQWRKTFLIQISKEGVEDFPMVILGNKIDMKEQREVTEKEARDWCKQHSILYLETSAKECIHVEKAFESVAQLCVDKAEPTDIKYEQIDLTKTAAPKQEGCSC